MCNAEFKTFNLIQNIWFLSITVMTSILPNDTNFKLRNLQIKLDKEL